MQAGAINKLMLFLPPRHGKSEMVTVRYPVYMMEQDPSLRVIVGAYNQSLAERFSRRSRRLAAGCMILSRERNTAADWETAAGGGIRAVGVGVGVTGYGGDLIIIDDPVKNREEANSKTYRERVWDWYTDDLYTRREPGAQMVLIQTRWHEDDLAGRILASDDAANWTVVSLPALAEKDDPLGRAAGEALCPERFDDAALEGIRTVMGSWSFAALYQQRPAPLEGALFRREWFRTVEAAPEGLRWARYWDLAASVKTSADYTASVAAAMGPDGTVYYRDMVRGQWEWPDQERIIASTVLAEPGTDQGIEKALHGIAVLQTLARRRDLVSTTIRGIDVDKDKLTRALPLAARAEQGKVALVRGTWIGAFLDELCTFTGDGDAHDDQVDTASGVLAMVATGYHGRLPPARGKPAMAGIASRTF